MNFGSLIASSHLTPVPPGPPVEIGQEFQGTVPVISVFRNLGALFSSVANLLFMIAFVFAFAYLIWGGFRLITAGGEEQAVAEARETITYAIIGIVIVFLSYLIVKLVEGVTGVVIF